MRNYRVTCDIKDCTADEPQKSDGSLPLGWEEWRFYDKLGGAPTTILCPDHALRPALSQELPT